MIRILDRLYLGDCEDARDLRGLQQCGINHVVNCAEGLPNHHEGRLTYLALGLEDPDPRYRDTIESACRFIAQGRRAGGVLVHCFAGASRSPAIVLAFLCEQLETTMLEAARVLGSVAWTDPAREFLEQLAGYRSESKAELDRIVAVLRQQDRALS